MSEDEIHRDADACPESQVLPLIADCVNDEAGPDGARRGACKIGPLSSCCELVTESF